MPLSTLNHHDDAAPAPRVRPDDFVRLGIGISEARVGVIRRAAHAASAAVLAKSHLNPDPIHDDKLARIATSTYRILDPRGRNLFAQRVQLLHFESPPAEVPRWWEPKPTTIKKGLSKQDRFDPNAADDTYVPAVIEPPQPWDTITEQLGIPAVSRRAAGITGSCFAIVFVSIFIASSLRSAPESDVVEAAGQGRVVANASGPIPSLPPTLPPPAVPQSPASGTPSVPAPEIIVAPLDPAEPDPQLPATTPDQPGVIVDAGAIGSLKQSESLHEQESIVENEMAAKAVSEFDETMIADMPEKDGLLGTANTSELLADGAAAGISNSGFAEELISPLKTFDESTPKAEVIVVDPAENLLSGSLDQTEKDLAATLGEASSSETDPPAQAGSDETKPGLAKIEDPRYPIPQPKALATAADRMQRLLEDLPDAGADLNSVADIRAIRETILQCEPGSEDRWALMHEALRRLVLIGRDASAAQVINELVGEYQTEELSVRKAVLQEMLSASTIVQKERVVKWALQTSEQSLASEDFESAADATRSATTIAVRLGNGELRSRTSNQTDTIRQAKRMATAAKGVLEKSTLEDASSSEANSVGRYLCLYRRDWQQGLPWLTRASNAKIAQAAQRELDQEDDDTMEVVDAWADVASDERGRTSQSILLHCRDIALSELETSSGLKAKDIQRRIDELDAELPNDLRLPTKDTDDAMPAALPQNLLSGMLGRIKADGLDVGALVRYEPGLGLTRETFSQILDQLGVKSGVVSAEFVGLIDLEENSTIRFVAGGATQAADSVAVTVNDKAVALRENAGQDRHTGEIDLPAGVHLVRWQFGGKMLETCHLSIQDGRDQKAVTIRHTLALLRRVAGSSAPRLRVNVVSAR